VVDVVERDIDGDLMVRLTKGGRRRPNRAPGPDRKEAAAGAPGLGDRLLVRFETLESGEFEARLIKKLGQSAQKVLGVIRKGHREVRVEPVDRKSKDSCPRTQRKAAT
jgi:ribonuclease R